MTRAERALGFMTRAERALGFTTRDKRIEVAHSRAAVV
jgi:hypothetical protein